MEDIIKGFNISFVIVIAINNLREMSFINVIIMHITITKAILTIIKKFINFKELINFSW